MKAIIFFFVYVLFLNCVIAQQILVDHLEQVYVVERASIKKYDENAKELHSYSISSAGNIQNVDVSDPLKILVFYKNTGQIYYLDNTLSIIQGPINLQNLNVFSPLLLCMSSDKGFWVLDQMQFTLYRFDKQLKHIHQINNLNHVVAQTFVPEYMIEAEQNLYIYDSKIGVFVFDLYGSFITLLHIKDSPFIKIIGHHLFYQKADSILQYNLKNHTEIVVATHISEKAIVTLSAKNYYILDKTHTSNFHAVPLR